MSKFAPAYDCVGFFTAEIWTALLVTLLLGLILVAGIWMVANIKSNDQFSDPKGPVLHIHSQE